MAKKKAEDIKLTLTDEEREGLDNEGIKRVLTSKAILKVAKEYKFSDEEKEEFEYLFTNEKHKFFIAKLIEDKISVNENDVTKLYTDNKANFDAQNIPFSQAREIIQRDLLNQQVAVLEAEELNKLVEEMEDKLEISKKEILFSKGDSEVLKTLLVGKIISKKMADEKFEDQEQNKKDLEVIRDNVYINYYLDLEVRKNVKVTQEEVAEIIKKYDLIVLPVTDVEGRLLGIITIDDVMDVVEQEATEDFHRMAGISPVEESYLKTSAFKMARQRISWLIILMISATFTGRIIKNYESVLQSVVILSSFIPMLMDTGGNAGAQSSTIVVRALALGEVKPKDTFKILRKEFCISFIVAVVLAAINYLRLITMTRTPLNVALVVSVTLIFVVMISKIIGAFLPVVAKSLKMDPAIMAGPLITTILDALTLTIYFKFATIFLSNIIK